MDIQKLATTATPAKQATKTSTFVMLAASVIGTILLLLMLPAILAYLHITGDAAATITKNVFDRCLETIMAFGSVFGLTRGGVSLIKNAAPFVMRYLLAREAQRETAPPVLSDAQAPAPVEVAPELPTFEPVVVAPAPSDVQAENSVLEKLIGQLEPMVRATVAQEVAGRIAKD